MGKHRSVFNEAVSEMKHFLLGSALVLTLVAVVPTLAQDFGGGAPPPSGGGDFGGGSPPPPPPPPTPSQPSAPTGDFGGGQQIPNPGNFTGDQTFGNQPFGDQTGGRAIPNPGNFTGGETGDKMGAPFGDKFGGEFGGDMKFPGRGEGVEEGFPGKGKGVEGGFPGKGRGLMDEMRDFEKRTPTRPTRPGKGEIPNPGDFKDPSMKRGAAGASDMIPNPGDFRGGEKGIPNPGDFNVGDKMPSPEMMKQFEKAGMGGQGMSNFGGNFEKFKQPGFFDPSKMMNQGFMDQGLAKHIGKKFRPVFELPTVIEESEDEEQVTQESIESFDKGVQSLLNELTGVTKKGRQVKGKLKPAKLSTARKNAIVFHSSLDQWCSALELDCTEHLDEFESLITENIDAEEAVVEETGRRLNNQQQATLRNDLIKAMQNTWFLVKNDALDNGDTGEVEAGEGDQE